MQHHEDVNDCSFAHLSLILLLHAVVKCSRGLAVYDNEFTRSVFNGVD